MVEAATQHHEIISCSSNVENECTDFVMDISEPQKEETNVPIMVDKCVQRIVKFASVGTQFNPLLITAKQEIQKPKVLKVKIPVKKQRTSECNTDISFPPSANVIFSVEPEEIENENSSQCDIESELDSSFVIDEAIQLSDTDTDEDDDEDVSINEHDSPILESKFIVFWSCLKSLFKICSTCNQGAST